MGRITDAVVKRGELYATRAPALNLSYGGQMGFMPRIGTIGADGRSYEEWISNQAYIRRNVIPILLTYPRFFDYMPGGSAIWIRLLKAVMEQHPIKIDGLRQTLTIETDSHNVGAAGEIQEEYTKVNRAPSAVSYTWDEKAGESITRFWEMYTLYGMQDPDTGIANVKNYIDFDDYHGLYTADFYAFSMMFIEPDALGKCANRVWMINNMFPKGDLTVEGSRDIKAAGERKEISLEFSSLACPPNVSLHTMGERLLNGMNILKKIPDQDTVLPITDVNPSVLAADTGFDS